MKICKLFVTLTLFFSLGLLNAKEYHVAKTGNDRNTAQPKVGPIENLKQGRQEILVWPVNE